MGTISRPRWGLFVVLAAIAALAMAGTAVAAELAGGDVYRLEAGQVVDDDLIVSGQEIIIDGTVKGDLIAVGGFLEVNGVVEGDLMGAAAEVRLNGTVADDVRVGGGGVIIGGEVGDDLFAAAGGGAGTLAYSQVNGRQVRQGLEVSPDATVGGSAYFGAGSATIAGAIEEDLSVGAGMVDLGGSVGGDATIRADRLTVADDAEVAGQLTYTAGEEISVPPDTAGSVRFEPPPPPEPTNPGRGLVGQLVRSTLMLLGFVVAGWLLLRFAPRAIRKPAEALAARPGQAGLYGVAAAALLFVVPVLSVVLLIAIGLFWGWLPAVMFVLFLTAGLVLAWVLSPLLTGLWVGRALLRAAGRPAGDLVALLVGAAIVVLLGLLPVVGWLVWLASFLFALGAVILARQGAYEAPVPMTPAATPA